MTALTRVVTIVSIVGTGVMAGVFLIFSVAIMRSLEKLPPAQGMAAMNIINVRIVNPVFLLFFLGSALACLALAVLSFVGDIPGRWWRLAGAIVFLVGAMVVSFAVNIPLNDGLAAADPAGAHVAETWQKYLADWNPPNNIRTVTSIVATLLLVLGLPPRAETESTSQPGPQPVQTWSIS